MGLCFSAPIKQAQIQVPVQVYRYAHVRVSDTPNIPGVPVIVPLNKFHRLLRPMPLSVLYFPGCWLVVQLASEFQRFENNETLNGPEFSFLCTQ